MTSSRRKITRSLKRFSPSALFVLLAFSAVSTDQCFGTTYVWNVDANANWNTNGNWNIAGFPDSPTDIAQMTSAITAPRTVTLTNNVAIQEIFFDNANKYTVMGFGFTTFNAPILITQTGTHEIDSAINLADNLTVSNLLGTTLTLGGTISGNFGIIKEDAGFLTLSGNNTYTTGTTINGGVLSITSDANLGAPTGPLIFGPLGGELDINGSIDSIRNITLNGIETFLVFPTFTTTLGGNISGAGGLIKAGNGTLILSGTNSYVGTTLLNNGLLQVTTNSLPGNVFIPASFSLQTLVFDQDFDGTYAGNIVGPPPGFGSVVKKGTGTVTFTGGSNFAGATLVEEGTLDVEGIIETADVIVFPGAALTGNGTLTSIVTVAGSFTPTGSYGIFDINGALVQNPFSLLNIEITDATSALVDIVGISGGLGTATIIQDSTLNVIVDPGTYSPGLTYTVVQTTGGVFPIGTGFSVTSTAPAMNFSVIYNPFDIQIVLDSITFTGVVNQGNPGAVAQCVDTSNPTPGSDMSIVIANLAPLSTPELYAAFNQMQPAAFKALPISQQYITLEVENALSHRFIECTPTSCEGRQHKKKNQVWLDVFGSSQTQDKKEVAPESPIPSYTTKTFGALLGLDRAFTSNLCVGGVTGYTRGKLSMHMDTGHGHVESVYLGPYAQYGNKNVYLNASVLGEANWYKTFRNIEFNTIDRTARGSHHGLGALFHLGGGVWIRSGQVDVSPFVNFDYITMQEDSYTESDASSLDLHVHSSSYQFREIEGGILVRTCTRIPQGVIIPEIRFSVLDEHRSQGEHYKASLQGAKGCTFVVKGNSPNQTLFVPAASIKALLYHERLTVDLRYMGKFGEHFSLNEIALELGWAF